MSSKINGNQISSEACSTIRTCTAKEALKIDTKHIDVPADTNFDLSPNHPELTNSFAQIPLRSYEDLQILGLAPRGLPEEKVRRAIASDDDEVYKIVYTTPHRPATVCNCAGPTQPARSFVSSPPTAYKDIRNRHNPALAKLLSEHYGTHVPWDSPLPGIARSWTLALDAISKRTISVGVLRDIIIGRGATLTVDSRTKVLFVNDIKIHLTGRLVTQGGRYIRIWANSIGWFNDPIYEAHPRKDGVPPWSLIT